MTVKPKHTDDLETTLLHNVGLAHTRWKLSKFLAAHYLGIPCSLVCLLFLLFQVAPPLQRTSSCCKARSSSRAVRTDLPSKTVHTHAIAPSSSRLAGLVQWQSDRGTLGDTPFRLDDPSVGVTNLPSAESFARTGMGKGTRARRLVIDIAPKIGPPSQAQLA